MSAMTVLKSSLKTGAAGDAMVRARSWVNALNLHWAGVGLLVLVNVYILAQMGLLWHAASNYSPEAVAGQQAQRKTAETAAMPLRGLDTKLERATVESDRFCLERLPVAYSGVTGELGALSKRAGVRLARVSYAPAAVLQGSTGELTQVSMDATLSGDYRPLVLMLNSLERDRMFFVIRAVMLTGQQSGNVNLRLRLTTYLRPGTGDAHAETGLVATKPPAGGSPR